MTHRLDLWRNHTLITFVVTTIVNYKTTKKKKNYKNTGFGPILRFVGDIRFEGRKTETTENLNVRRGG